MAFNATEFRSKFLKNSNSRPAANNLFELTFDRLPNVLEGKLTPGEKQIFDDLRYRVQTADVPARSFETQERRYNGPQRIIPFGLIYTTQQIEIIEDENGTVKKIFDKWHSAVFNQNNSYTVAYYDDIISDMRLKTFKKSGALSSEIKFVECFPVSVQPAQLSWASNDTVMVIPVELAYREWRIIR